MMFRPDIIYIFDLTVILIMRYLKKDVWVLKNHYKTEILIVITETDFLFMKFSLLSVNRKKIWKILF